MFLDKLHHIKGIILDIDGVLTDATVLVTETGEQLRRFNVRDGYAMQLAVKRGFKVCSISGGKSKSVVLRLNSLGITDIHLGIDKKLDVFNSFLEQHALNAGEVLYIGDDIPDVPVMKIAGAAACPADAAEEVKAVSMYISPKVGGAGCVRDILEKLLKVQRKWFDAEPSAHDDSIPSA
ncbi:3-deoxy-D-manno-octulosonate 8-phosphate phosphatase [Pedobacter sp. BS3]|uniref:KdsC family phosphatase n=1 Tax=Pedobacter sp. BS3 TaxID=2567937 RepID=UPI0011EFC565|nr:3-deoxy-D-manno-octulosonate 8-phosphate phosphatase [Pedobacter sp. BS3]TZF83724.1 3-deoxy-D-manno-octulosonate 8-phosphate phosphatase [Pedobacter sp. BS3]